MNKIKTETEENKKERKEERKEENKENFFLDLS